MANITPEFNREIRRVVKSFNQKIRRAEARGVKGLPEIRSVRELKAQFATENDLKREVDSLKTLLNNKEALQRRTLKEGTVSNWQYEYLARNLQATKRFVDRELEKAEERLKEYPKYLYSIRADIETLEHKKDILNRDLSKLTADELRTTSAIVRQYKRSNLRIRAGRERFMNNLDQLLAPRGVSVKDRKAIYEKLDSLTNEQFEEFYRRHDIVSDVMIMIPSPTSEANEKQAKETFDSEDDEADAIAQEFLENIDQYIEEVKSL